MASGRSVELARHNPRRLATSQSSETRPARLDSDYVETLASRQENNLRAWTATWLIIVVVTSACGGDRELSLNEYIEQFNALTDPADERYANFVAGPDGSVLLAEGDQLGDYTPQQLGAALDLLGAIEAEVMVAAAEINPPDQVAEFHEFFFATSNFTAAREALAIRASTTADWVELSESPEMAAYRAAIAEDKQACIDFEAAMDEAAEGQVFSDVPWFPSEFREDVERVLGCESFPDHPDDLYRP